MGSVPPVMAVKPIAKTAEDAMQAKMPSRARGAIQIVRAASEKAWGIMNWCIRATGLNMKIEMLNRNEKLLTGSASHTCANVDSTCAWVPEYGAWMVEGTPAQPYAGLASDLLRVEKNMRKRRAKLLHVLNPDEICPTVPCFPLLGVGEFTSPAAP